MAIHWNSVFDGPNGTTVTSSVPLVGTFGVPQDALANGGVLEVEAGELRCRGTLSTLVYLPLTGWTPGTPSQTIEIDVRAGTIGGAGHGMSIIVRAKLPGDFYLFGISQNGIFLDKYLGDVFSSNLYVSSTGIVSGTVYTLRIDCFTSGQNILTLNGVERYNATDPAPIVPDGQENWIVGDNTGVAATPSRLSRVTVYSGIETVPALQSPVETFDTDLTAVELGGIALASEEIAAAGPTIYVIESATALQLTGTTTVTRSAAIASATQLQLTGATAAAATLRVTSTTALSLTNAQSVLIGPAISLATALSLAGATDVRQLARILSATQLQLTGEIPVLYIGGTPVYEIVSATQLLLTGAMPIRFDAAAALATSVALQGGTGVTTAARIAAATALSFAQAALVRLSPDVRLATALGLAGATPMSLASAIAGGTVLTLTGVTTLQRLLPFGSATQLLLANAIPVVLDTGTPIYVITSTTQLQLTGGIGIVQVPRVSSPTSLALANAQPVVGGPAVSLVTALSLAGSILARTDREIAAGSALGLEGQSLARLSTLVIQSATELQLSGQILIGIVTPTGIAWVTYRTLVAPAVASLIARAPAVRSASRTAPAVRLQRAVLPSLDEVP